jgi:SOS-response transcriptional repressor LexA
MDLEMFIGNKIKYYRKERNMTQDRLAEKLGLGKGTISNYESGYRTPQQDRLFELAEILEISINDLFPPTKKNEKDINSIYNQLESPRQAKVYNFVEYQLKEQNKVKETVQVYGDAAAGAPIDCVDGFVDEEEVETVPEGANRALRIKGKSMSPLLKDGQLVFYKAQPQLENEQVGIFEIHGEAVTCKRYKVDFDSQKIVLKSENPDYEDMIFNGNEVRILGEVKL